MLIPALCAENKNYGNLYKLVYYHLLLILFFNSIIYRYTNIFIFRENSPIRSSISVAVWYLFFSFLLSFYTFLDFSFSFSADDPPSTLRLFSSVLYVNNGNIPNLMFHFNVFKLDLMNI